MYISLSLYIYIYMYINKYMSPTCFNPSAMAPVVAQIDELARSG